MSDQQPLLRVVRGAPTNEELAALTVVLTAQAASAAAASSAAPETRQPWRDKAPMMRAPLHPGRDAWRTSARPR